jgi:YidC/Oxa1 family membrane protein insertase
MDRKSWIGVIVCFALLLGWEFYSARRWHVALAANRPAAMTATSSATGNSTPTLQASNSALIPAPLKAPANLPGETTTALENDDIRAVLTTHGGAIKEILLKKHFNDGQNIVLNRDAPEPVLNLSGWEDGFTLVPYVMEKSGEGVLFRRKQANGIEITRLYRLDPAHSCSVVLEQTVTNAGHDTVQLPDYRLNVGTVGPIHLSDSPLYVSANWYSEKDQSSKKISIGDFKESSILGFRLRGPKSEIESGDLPLAWTAVKNQFFVLIVASPPDNPILHVVARPELLPAFDSKSGIGPEGIKLAAFMPGFTLAPGAIKTETFNLYDGPKEYARVEELGRRQDLVMDFGWFGWVIRPLLSFMRFVHSYVPNWGISIILMTVIIKTLLWPLQSIANKSMKQMQALQPKLEQLREKYKDNPERLNTEMIGLYREYGVNPAGGCLPLLVQMPIFIGFYIMLQSVIELRGASFLWIHDLTQPDTVAHVAGFEVNLLPIIMTATSLLLMRMSPQTQGSDNPQAKLMQWTPLIFLFILYKFAAALALYWTINNLISMAQTYINLRKPVPSLQRQPKKKQAVGVS